jgi:hypothetical protein
MSRLPLGAALAARLVLLLPLAAHARSGDLSPALARSTDDRYDHDCFWGGPRGSAYVPLQAIQRNDLYPDTGATYFVGQFRLPAGATLDFAGTFPHARYLSYAIQTPLGGGSLGSGDFLRDDAIRPDPGAVNPFVVGAPRDDPKRGYLVHVVGGPVPATRAPNTLYTGNADPDALVTLVLRHYLPDAGRDGTGGAGLPRLTLRLADGATLTGADACAALQATKDGVQATFPVAAWHALVAAAPDPATAPAPQPPRWQRFWNIPYSVLGAFVPDQAERQARYPATEDGGFASNPDARYLTSTLSRRFGTVAVIRGRMPRTPAAVARMGAYDLRYWSLCSGSAPTSGLAWDCVFDRQVALSRSREYTIVVSTPADRPPNARPACGVTWLDFGQGEANPDGTGRTDYALLYLRFMDPAPGFTHAPQSITKPNTEAEVLGPYLPRTTYTSTRAFARRGC